MNSRKLLILSLVSLGALATGVWIASERSSSTLDEYSQLYPGLKKSLNDATAVRVFKAGDELAVELTRENDAWRVRQREDYPADEAKLRTLLLGIADAQLREEKTSNPERYASLGVEDVSEPDATGQRIEVSGAEAPVDLIVGKRGPGTQSRYVRRAGETQSWLIDTELDVSARPEDWLRKSIVDIGADRVQSASITTKAAKPYGVEKKSRADADFTVDAIPKGKELSSPSAANSLATALSGLTLSDVQPASAFDAKPEAEATYRTFDGLVIDLDGWQRDDKRYVALKAAYDESLAERFKVATVEATQAGESDTEAEDGEAPPSNTGNAEAIPTSEAATPAEPEPAKPDAGEQAGSLNATAEGWIYEVPAYKYDAIFKPLEDMLKK